MVSDVDPAVSKLANIDPGGIRVAPELPNVPASIR
jgi:hypothetical protein